MKNFISVDDVTNMDALVQTALKYKASPFTERTLGKDKRIGCLFFNPSMRTRLSTQIAAQNLGMEAIVLNVGQEGWTLEFEEGVIMNGTSVEHIKDAAPVLGSYFDMLGVRTFPSLKDREEDYSEKYLHQFIKYAGVPIISLESATLHPLQSLADIITIEEYLQFNNKEHLHSLLKSIFNEAGEDKNSNKIKVVLSWAPHVKPLPQCVANSFSQWMNAWGKAEFVITHPAGYQLDESFTKGATIITNQDEALKNADFVYVKNWSSYHDYGKILCNDECWMLTNEKLTVTNNAKVMHCLPVRRNVELSDEILDGPNSIVTQQAANRVWSAQAVLSEILETSNYNIKHKGDKSQ
ncbi:MAG: acetylornithine carbamoyltransferase [Chitinophagaceae bacterium]|nr:acetylornithine carbamoyltransferase [Chitinophagaceae bacterium]